MKYFRLFSFLVSSELELDILPEIEQNFESPDVRIVRGNMSSFSEICSYNTIKKPCFFVEPRRTIFNVDATWFKIENGKTIVVFSDGSISNGLLQSYILGNCFGALLQQRGILLLHGSCVYKNGKAYVIVGRSGSGKSTLAREFLNNGWKLVTDDVSAIKFFEDGTPFVIPSYPSQKLWQDAIERYNINSEMLQPLWKEQEKTKYNTDVSTSFNATVSPLIGVIWIRKSREDYYDGCRIEKVLGFATVNILMQNIYRSCFRCGTEEKNLMFQQCVNLSSRVDAYSVIRDVHGDTAFELYTIIKEMIGE